MKVLIGSTQIRVFGVHVPQGELGLLRTQVGEKNVSTLITKLLASKISPHVVHFGHLGFRA